METPRRWAVSLAADDAIDLKIARTLFEIGDPQVGEIKIFTGRLETALFSDRFERLAEALDVAEASSPIIDAINGICFIHDSARSSLKRSAIHERLPDGVWGGGIAFASASAAGGSRAVAFANALDKDGNVQSAPQSRQSIWLQNAVKDADALDVLAYVRGTPDWFLLYKAYEAMKSDGGGEAVGWPDTGRFSRSANIRRHFSGHSSAKQTPGKPFVPMELREATDFVRLLATLWLNSRYASTGPK